MLYWAVEDRRFSNISHPYCLFATQLSVVGFLLWRLRFEVCFLFFGWFSLVKQLLYFIAFLEGERRRGLKQKNPQNSMWDLNDSPDQRRDDESEGCSSQKTSVDSIDDKGKRVGSVSNENSSSSAVVIEDGSDEEDGERGQRKRSSKIFGFSVTHEDEGEPPVTRQFFPMEESEMGTTSCGGAAAFPRAHWVGVKFCQSEPLNTAGVATAKSLEASQPLKKSRRGPRSRSSQYRGVTFYRRTGRWESHIWFVLFHCYRSIFPLPWLSFLLFNCFSVFFSAQISSSSLQP